MGFPEWTLWGMGLSVLGTFLFLTLSLIAQSPGLQKRVGLTGARLDLRVRTFTSFAFALLLLAMGFFLAGVPLNSESSTATANQTPQATASLAVSLTPAPIEDATSQPEQTTAPATPVSGAFGGPPPTATPPAGETITSATPDDPSVEVPTANESPILPAPSATPSPTSSEPTNTPTTTSTPTPTETPMPTLTPTPIAGRTAIVITGGSNVWLYRSPGGQNLVVVSDGDRVIVLAGHANQGGILWQEVSTLDGVTGWIEEERLEYEP